MTDSRFTEWLEGFRQRVQAQRAGEPDDENVLPMIPGEEAFTTVFVEDMTDVGLLGDAFICHHETRVGNANAKINGYSMPDDGGEVTLIVSVAAADDNGDAKPPPPGDVRKAVSGACHMFRGARRGMHDGMESSSDKRDMMERIHADGANLELLRILVVVNGAGTKTQEFEPAEDLPRTLVDVWDLERLYRAVSSGLAYESLEVDVTALLGAPLPCLVGPDTADDHQCYFAIIPGELLYLLYQEHGARLLELNVRSFLQARGKVNRGIRDTLMNDPEHFLPFNNGISATVESLELVEQEGGGVGISRLTGLQVVNGGQTMASIHRAKDRDKVDLSAVSVQAKITRIEPEEVENLVPMISRCSNTQNKVNETDFSANHPFHVRFQELSERVWLPDQSSRWFYERARGQYEVARNREGRTPAKLRKFDLKTPKSQKLDKTLLAKALNTWEEKPDIVSRGGQKCFVDFMSSLSRRGSSWVPDEDYYKEAVAKVILFKRAEKIARQLKFDAYRANAVAYTVSLLAYRCCGRLDFAQIWDNQDVSAPVEDTMRKWMPEIQAEIVESAGGHNVTEWCKKKDCWAGIQSMGLQPEPGLATLLDGAQPVPTVGRFNKKGGKGKKVAPKPLSPEERERQAQVMKLDVDEWQRMVRWMRTKSEYAGFPVNVSSTVLGYCASGWQNVPSPRQTEPLVGFIDAWREECRDEDEKQDAISGD